MRNRSVIFLGKTLSRISQQLNFGHGSTWPGHIALKVNNSFIEDILKGSQTKVIMVAGTNGKTTTSLMIRTILEGNDHAVLHNESGANLLNGIASTLLLKAKSNAKIVSDYAIFEVDENALPQALSKITPDYLIILNLFRDQLDRYGEVDSIAKKWQTCVEKLPEKTTLILNADDPQVAYLGTKTKAKTLYFGLQEKTNGNTNDFSSDSLYCPKCSTKLRYIFKTYSHLGNWYCSNCHLRRPKISTVKTPPTLLKGTYNQYNTASVMLLAQELGIAAKVIEDGLRNVKPAFGRQEIIEIGNKKVQLYLSKNPTGFNESLRTVHSEDAKHIMLALNDRTADGHDVSWIWDVDFESFIKSFDSITISGDRAYDMGLRIKYAFAALQVTQGTYQIEEDLEKGITNAVEKLKQNQTLYVLPTYTAMLEVRKILKGKKIL